MAETTMNSQAEPSLVRDAHEPKGVLRKNLKPLIYLGAAALVILAAVFSGTSKKTPSQQAAARHEPPQPTVQDNTDNNVQDLKNQLAAEQQKEAQQAGLANATAAQQTAAAAYSPTGQAVPCVPGQPCAQPNMYGQQPGGQPQVSPAQVEAQQLAAKERELAYNSRFASNLVYSHQPDSATSQQPPAGPEGASVASYQQAPNQYMTASSPAGSSLVAPRAAGDRLSIHFDRSLNHTLGKVLDALSLARIACAAKTTGAIENIHVVTREHLHY